MKRGESSFVVILFLLLNLINVTFSYAQMTWLEAGKLNDKMVLHDFQTEVSYEAAGGTKLINYNATIKIEEPINVASLVLPYGQCQVFTIFQSNENSTEGLIWSLNAGQTNQMLFTDKRYADLLKGKFINFYENKSSTPQLYTYHHLNKGLKIDNLLIGDVPNNKEIPVGLFEGDLAEIIVFDRILTPQSRQILESTLALKYGLKLGDNFNYLSTRGNVLWDRINDYPFNNNISGIGKATSLHFNQKQSKSVFGAGSVSLGLNGIYTSNLENPSILTEEQYLIWADNGKEVEFLKQNGNPLSLQRKWKYKSLNAIGDQRYSIKFDHFGLTKALTEKMNYWLVVTKGNDTEFTFKTSSFYKLEKHGTGFLCNNISLKSEGYFTILKTPDFWASSFVVQPNCQAEKKGSISIKPIGGNPPFQISMINEEGATESFTFNDSIWVSPEITVGNYKVSIFDINGNRWADSILVNYTDIEDPKIIGSYILNEKGKVVLDASAGMESAYEYIWIFPEGKEIFSPVLVATTPGIYTLSVSKEECVNEYTVLIKDTNNLIEDLSLSPNPSADGIFNLDGELSSANSYQIQIHNNQGVLIKTTNFAPAKYIQYQGKVQDAGVYYVTLSTGQSHQTLKLIVINSH